MTEAELDAAVARLTEDLCGGLADWAEVEIVRCETALQESASYVPVAGDAYTAVTGRALNFWADEPRIVSPEERSQAAFHTALNAFTLGLAVRGSIPRLQRVTLVDPAISGSPAPLLAGRAFEEAQLARANLAKGTTVACSPKADPGVMRVAGWQRRSRCQGLETLDETQEAHARPDHCQVA